MLGAEPANLAANQGNGSTKVLVCLGGGRYWERHAANDLLAGMWAFAAFMIAGAIYGAIDLASEPGLNPAMFLASQIPFAVGATMLALAAYPDTINKPLWCVSAQALDDELAEEEERRRNAYAKVERAVAAALRMRDSWPGGGGEAACVPIGSVQ